MSNGIKQLDLNARVVDCSGMEYLEDLPPGGMVGLRTTQEGYDEVVAEILSNQADVGRDIGITADDIAGIKRSDRRVAEIDAVLPTAEKLVEVLHETKAVTEDEQHRRILEIAALVDARAKARRDPSLLARYEKTRAYRSAVGNKAAATRRRNEVAANAAAAADETVSAD